MVFEAFFFQSSLLFFVKCDIKDGGHLFHKV